MAILEVGYGKAYSTHRAAYLAAADGDILHSYPATANGDTVYLNDPLDYNGSVNKNVSVVGMVPGITMLITGGGVYQCWQYIDADMSGQVNQAFFQNLTFVIAYSVVGVAIRYNDTSGTGKGLLIDRCKFIGGQWGALIAKAGNSPEVRSCLFMDLNYGFLGSDSPIAVNNCTFINAGLYGNSKAHIIKNCLLMGNLALTTFGSATGSNNSWDFGTAPGTAPLALTRAQCAFFGALSGGIDSLDYRPTLVSSLIDAGANTTATNDINGTAFSSGHYPIGCSLPPPFLEVIPAADKILTGNSATNVYGTVTNGSASGATNPDYVLSSQGGNYNDANLTVGNIRPVAFGLAQTGTLANLVATDAAYVTLENSRNNDNGTVAADIMTGKSVKIRDVTTNGSASGGSGFDMVYWVYDENGDLMPRIPPLSAAPQVQTATLVAADVHNGGDATFTITNSDAAATNSVYIAWWGQNGNQAWQLVGSRTGNGVVTGHYPVGLYACKVVSVKTDYGSSTGVGNLFYLTDLTNVSRIRIRDAVASATLKVCYKLGFQAQYQTAGRAAITIWVVPETTDSNLSLLGSQVGQSFSVLGPRQADFPPMDDFAPGSRLGIGGVWYDVDVNYPAENTYYSPVFSMKLYRMNDVTVELDGTDI